MNNDKNLNSVRVQVTDLFGHVYEKAISNTTGLICQMISSNRDNLDKRHGA